jgi:hypothetical protein
VFFVSFVVYFCNLNLFLLTIWDKDHEDVYHWGFWLCGLGGFAPAY